MQLYHQQTGIVMPILYAAGQINELHIESENTRDWNVEYLLNLFL